MTSQIEWIKSASGDARRYRAMVIGWQNSLYAINQLIQTYNKRAIQQQPEERDQNVGTAVLGALS
jgi:hypothetical protein